MTMKVQFDAWYFAINTGGAAEANQKGIGGKRSKFCELNRCDILRSK